MGARILLVEEHNGMRTSLRRILDGDPDIQVVGETEDAGPAIEMAPDLNPDVIVMDLDVRGLNRTATVQRILKAVPGVRVLALSLHCERPYAKQALKDGVSGFLLKIHAFEELVPAIRAVMTGEVFVGKGPDGRPLNEDRQQASGRVRAGGEATFRSQTADICRREGGCG